jgi:hypothetical protein
MSAQTNALTSQPESPRSFDVSTEANAVRESYLATRWPYYWGIVFPLVAGPVLGYVELTKYNGPVVATVFGLLLSLPFVIVMSLLAVRLRRYFPTSVTIGGGRLSFEKPGGQPASFDLRAQRSRVVVHTHIDGQRGTGCPTISGRPVTPWVERGFGQLLPLSHEAADALAKELELDGWSMKVRERPWGAFRFLTWTFTKDWRSRMGSQ